MQTLLPIRDQLPVSAPEQRKHIPALTKSDRYESKLFSQVIKKQQQADLRDKPLKVPENPESNIDKHQESQSKSTSSNELDATKQLGNNRDTQKFADQIADNNSQRADDAHDSEFEKPHAQNQTGEAQGRQAESAETSDEGAALQSIDQENIEVSHQESNDFVVTVNQSSFESTPQTRESETQNLQSQNESIEDSKAPAESEVVRTLQYESVDTETKPIGDEQISRTNTQNPDSSIEISNKEPVAPQKVADGENVKPQQAQSQSTLQVTEDSVSTENKIDASAANEKQDQSAVRHRETQVDSSASNNVRSEDQPVRPEPRPATQTNTQITAQSNKQVNTQTNTQTAAQASPDSRVSISADHQQSQSAAQQQTSDNGYSAPKADEAKAKSNSDQPVKMNLPETHESPSLRSAASIRADQIDNAVRLENATGQSVTAQIQAKQVIQLAPNSPLVNNSAEGQTLNLPNSSADSLQDTAQARILRGLTATLNQRGGALVMRLDPPELGQLRIQMSIVRGIVTANFQVQTPQAQALLERSLATLRSALQGQGLTVERISVQTTPQSNAQSARHETSDQQNSQQRSNHDASQGESRGKREDHSAELMVHKQQFRANEYASFDLLPQPTGAD